MILAGGFAGVWLAVFTGRAKPFEPLFIAPNDLDFGRVWEDRAFERDIHVQNQYGYPLTTIELAASCDCTRVEPLSLSLGAGGNATIHVVVDLARARARQRRPPVTAPGEGRSPGERPPEVEYQVAAEIGARCKGVHGGWLPVQTWALTGNSRMAMSIEPDAVSFGDSLVEGQAFPSRVVQLHAYVPLARVAAKTDSDVVDVELRGSADDGTDRQIVIRPKAGLGAGTHRCEVLIGGETPNGESLPQRRFPVELQVLGDVAATPTAINFGAYPRGSTVAETLVIQTRSGAAIDVECLDLDSPGTRVETVRSDPSFKQFRVNQEVTDVGEHKGTLRFLVRRHGEGEVAIPIAVRYLGLED
jgi:hypothetical protein